MVGKKKNNSLVCMTWRPCTKPELFQADTSENRTQPERKVANYKFYDKGSGTRTGLRPWIFNYTVEVCRHGVTLDFSFIFLFIYGCLCAKWPQAKEKWKTRSMFGLRQSGRLLNIYKWCIKFNNRMMMKTKQCKQISMNESFFYFFYK